MNAMTRDEANEILTARIRALQAIYSDAHEALTNWGLWSMDRSGLFPKDAVTSIFDQFKRDGTEGYGDKVVEAPEAPAKAEGPEKEPYDEKAAILLDERMHGAGGLPAYVRIAIRTAYVTREVPESQFPRLTGCGWDAFCERLEEALRFAGRFV